MQLVNIGFGNIVSAQRIVAIVSPESAPIKRMVQEAKDNKTAVDATYGRRTRAVLIMDSGHIILSAVQPERSIPIFLFSIQIILRFSEKNWDTAKTNYNVFPSASHAQ